MKNIYDGITFIGDKITDHTSAYTAEMKKTIMLLGDIYGYYNEDNSLAMIKNGKWYLIPLTKDFAYYKDRSPANRDSLYRTAIDIMSDHICNEFEPFSGMNKDSEISVTSEYGSIRITTRCHISELIGFTLFNIFSMNKPNIGALPGILFGEGIQPLNRDKYEIYKELMDNWELMIYRFYIHMKGMNYLKGEVKRILGLSEITYEKI